jgi:Family of unknown function (DUF5681)
MPWLPGQSGNPEGLRAGKPIRDAIRLELAMMEQGKLDPVPKLSARAMVRAQIKKAVKGDTAAFNAIADRSDGKPRVVFSGDEEEPIAISVTRGDDARSRIEAALNQLATRQAVIEAVADEGSEQP